MWYPIFAKSNDAQASIKESTMINANIIQAKALIEAAAKLIDDANVKNGMAGKNKEKALKSLGEAINALNWMNKMNGNIIADFIDKIHEDDEVVNF